MQIEEEKLEKEFLYFSSLTNGIGSGVERGQSSSAIAKFAKIGPKIFLVEPNYNYRAVTGNADEKAAVENAFAKSVVWSFVPVAFEDGKYLVDLTTFLIRDSQKIGDRIGARGQGPGAATTGRAGAATGSAATYRFDETRSVIDIKNTKNFPKNSEFEAMITFTGGPSAGGRGGGGGSSIAPDPNAVTVTMHQ